MTPAMLCCCPPLVFQVLLLIDGREHFTDLKGHNRTSSLQQHLDKAGLGCACGVGCQPPADQTLPADVLQHSPAFLRQCHHSICLKPNCLTDAAGGAGCGGPPPAHRRRAVDRAQQVGGWL